MHYNDPFSQLKGLEIYLLLNMRGIRILWHPRIFQILLPTLRQMAPSYFRMNFRENAKSKAFFLELNIVNIFRPYFLINSISFRPTFSLELPQLFKNKYEKVVSKSITRVYANINLSGVYFACSFKTPIQLINKYHYCIQNTFFHNNACWETCILPKIRIILEVSKSNDM